MIFHYSCTLFVTCHQGEICGRVNCCYFPNYLCCCYNIIFVESHVKMYGVVDCLENTVKVDKCVRTNMSVCRL